MAVNRGICCKPLSVYIHIPFCKSKCCYCDFLSAPLSKADEGLRESYVRTLIGEIATAAPGFLGYEVRTVFIGGGTPSMLAAGEVEAIISSLKENYNFSQSAPEITIEVNPASVTGDILSRYREYGINRLSIGLQSANDNELKLLGRPHNYADFLATYEAARKECFTNINIDLIQSIPGQTLASFSETLSAVVRLEPEHISVYSLIIEEGTPFFERYGTLAGGGNCGLTGLDNELALDPGNPPLLDDEADRELYHYAFSYLESNDYSRYEISNFAKNGYECRHNTVYWKRGDYLGFGVGAASLINNIRWTNEAGIHSYLKSYITIYSQAGDTDKWTQPKPPAGHMDEKNARKENQGKFAATRSSATPNAMEARRLSQRNIKLQALSKNEQIEEYVFLGLRMTEGISATDFSLTFGMDLYELYGDLLKKLEADGLIAMTGERIALTPLGIDVSNYVMAQFLLD